MFEVQEANIRNLGLHIRSQVSVECRASDISRFVSSKLDKTHCLNLQDTDTRFEFSVSPLLVYNPSLMIKSNL